MLRLRRIAQFNSFLNKLLLLLHSLFLHPLDNAFFLHPLENALFLFVSKGFLKFQHIFIAQLEADKIEVVISVHVGVEGFSCSFHDMGQFDLAMHGQRQSSIIAFFVLVQVFIVFPEADAHELYIVGLLLVARGVKFLVQFVDLGMGVLVASPNHLYVSFEGVHELLVLGDSVKTILDICFTSEEGQIFVGILFGEAGVVEEEVPYEFHDVWVLVLEVDLVERGIHIFVARGVHGDPILQSVLLGEYDGLNEAVLFLAPEDMQTLPVDFHDFDPVFPDELILAIGDDHNRPRDIRDEICEFADNQSIDEFIGWIEGLEVMTPDIVAIAAVVKADVEVEQFINQVVCSLIGSDVQIFNMSLHHQIFLDEQEGQQQILVAVVGTLEIHLVVESVLEDRAAYLFHRYQVPCNPLELTDQSLEIVLVRTNLVQCLVLLAVALKGVQAHMHSLVVYEGSRCQLYVLEAEWEVGQSRVRAHVHQQIRSVDAEMSEARVDALLQHLFYICFGVIDSPEGVRAALWGVELMQIEGLHDEQDDLVGEEIDESEDRLLLVVDPQVRYFHHEVVLESLFVDEGHGLEETHREVDGVSFCPFRLDPNQRAGICLREGGLACFGEPSEITETEVPGCPLEEHEIGAFIDVESGVFKHSLVHPEVISIDDVNFCLLDDQLNMEEHGSSVYLPILIKFEEAEIEFKRLGILVLLGDVGSFFQDLFKHLNDFSISDGLGVGFGLLIPMDYPVQDVVKYLSVVVDKQTVEFALYRDLPIVLGMGLLFALNQDLDVLVAGLRLGIRIGVFEVVDGIAEDSVVLIARLVGQREIFEGQPPQEHFSLKLQVVFLEVDVESVQIEGDDFVFAIFFINNFESMQSEIDSAIIGNIDMRLIRLRIFLFLHHIVNLISGADLIDPLLDVIDPKIDFPFLQAVDYLVNHHRLQLKTELIDPSYLQIYQGDLFRRL